MNSSPRVGLLPLYLELYDKTNAEWRKAFIPFLQQIQEGFEREGVSVSMAEICRIRPEFERAVAAFEAEGVDLLAGVHLAYSPSLESIDALAKSSLPLLLLDTTMDYEFGRDTEPARIMFNHGIHGVQDLASMLRRHKRPYRIAAGHVTESNLLPRAAGIARAAHAARCLHGMRALRIGESFRGMGDFAVAEEELHRAFGVCVDTSGVDTLARAVDTVAPDAIAHEIEADRQQYAVEVDEVVHRRSVTVSLALRHLLEQGGYSAFSMNFLAFDRPGGPVDTVPFLEASKAMARGLGYAGEGDVLTACLVGALNKGFGATTFTEIFCPDWKGNSLFLSHMGELNPAAAANQPRLIEKDFPFTPAQNPAILTCAFQPGPAALVNLAPGPDDSFGLICAEVEVLEDTRNPAMRDSIRTWIRPCSGSLANFLEEYSRHGGTHHSALVYGVSRESLEAFAAFCNLPVVYI